MHLGQAWRHLQTLNAGELLESFVDRIEISFKGFYWPKARRKDVQKSSDISVYNTINREEVDGVVHRNIGTFLYIFSSRFWSVKSFKTCQNASQEL